MDLFEFDDYKTYLRELIQANINIRGYKTSLSNGASCQKSYFSKVLNANSELSLEQAINLAEFLNFDDKETDYFLDLVSLARAGNGPLKRKLSKRIAQLKKERNILAKRFKEPSIQKKEEMTYYSSWIYSAIHIMVDLAQYREPEKIAKRLNISPKEVVSILKKLSEFSLVKKNGTKWEINSGNVHLPSDSPMVSVHHQNWRSRAVLNSQDRENEGIHYTVVQSHSKQTLEKIKNLLLKDIDKVKKIVRSSEPEEITCIAIDFFSL